MRTWVLASLMLVPPIAAAQDLRGDLDRHWPLQLATAEVAIAQATLGPPVYAAISRGDAADLLVLDADGRQLPAALQLAAAPAAVQSWHRLPWFALPAAATAYGDDLSVIARRDAAGRMTTVESRLQARPADSGGDAWLVDASALDGGARVIALEWDRAQPVVQLVMRVEGSDDLRQWRLLEPGAEVLALQQDGQQLAQMRIALGGGARYLRLRALQGGRLSQLSGVQALASAADALADDLQWRELAASAVDGGWEFTLDGRYPVSVARVQGEGNSAVRWILSSRDDPRHAWQRRAGPWLGYQLGGQDSSAAQPLQQLSRDRHWRLQVESGVAAASPQLLLGYRPEQLLFIVQGPGPYSLAAGSARVQRAPAPVAATVQAMRQRHGGQWQPARASVGQVQALAGERALRPRRDWTTLLLWGVLVAAAVVVGGLGLSLLRMRGPAQPD